MRNSVPSSELMLSIESLFQDGPAMVKMANAMSLEYHKTAGNPGHYSELSAEWHANTVAAYVAWAHAAFVTAAEIVGDDGDGEEIIASLLEIAIDNLLTMEEKKRSEEIALRTLHEIIHLPGEPIPLPVGINTRTDHSMLTQADKDWLRSMLAVAAKSLLDCIRSGSEQK